MVLDKTFIKIVIAIFFLFMACTSCVPLGPHFVGINEIPINQSLIYVYRPPDGTIRTMEVSTEARDVVMLSGSYFYFQAIPGKVTIWSKSPIMVESLSIEVEPGKIYFIQAVANFNFWGRLLPHLAVVPTSVGEEEIVQCQIIRE
ncbi:MAG: hypothetical protein IT393_07105 [Nitrospirae bacterium]|nr:hypothetical protein [Nitrospirota bacterium]